jgi:hypothetical protein
MSSEGVSFSDRHGIRTKGSSNTVLDYQRLGQTMSKRINDSFYSNPQSKLITTLDTVS